MAGKGTRHRFELSRLEIAGVVVSAVTGLFVVFLLGIYAGRGLGDRRPDDGERIVRVPVAPAVEQTPAPGGELTFYDTLGRPGGVAKPGSDAGARPAAAPPAAAVAQAPAAALAPEKKPEPLADDDSDAEAAPSERAAVPQPEVGAKPEPPMKVAKEDHRRPAAAPSPAVQKAERAPTPPSTARVAVALAPNAAATPAVRTGARGDWSVQVSATRDPRTADAILRRLKTKGYEAFVLKVRRRGETFYRVRVGHYASLEEAQQVVTRLRREPGVPEAFVASD